MSTERKFSQAISMPCTLNEYLIDIHEPISRITDMTLGDPTSMTFIYFRHGATLWSGRPTVNPKEGQIDIEHYNPELFLALASMSEGPEFYPGEWVVINDRSIDELLIVHQSENSYLCVKRIEEKDEPGYFTVPKENFRKATVEEIIAFYQKKKPQPIGCSEDPIYQGFDVTSTKYTGEIEITFNGVKYVRADSIQPQTKENQLPRFGEEIQIWENGDKKRSTGYFISIDPYHDRVVVSYKDLQCMSATEPFHVYRYQNYARMVDPVYIPAKEAFEELAASRGVHPDQIKIDFDK